MDSSKIRGLNRLKKLMDNEQFVRELVRLHDLPDNDLSKEDEGELSAGIYALISKYKLLQSHYPILESLVESLNLDKAIRSDLEPVARLIDHNKKVILPSENPELEYQIAEKISDFKSGVVIQLNSDIGKDELVDFIKKNFSKVIKPSLTKRKKLSHERKSDRNNLIRKEIESGKNIADIEVAFGINQSRVYKIKKQQ